jgi:hypothetical protein
MMLERIMNNYPQVNATWLLTGEGVMLTDGSGPAPAAMAAAMQSGNPAELLDQQDLTLLRQRADYLARENGLLRGFIADLRRLMPTLQTPAPAPAQEPAP